MIDLIIVATGWAIWDLFVFCLPKDRGYFSLKTHSGWFKWDFPHHLKILILGLIAYRNVDDYAVLAICAMVAFNIQIIIYNGLSSTIFNKPDRV